MPVGVTYIAIPAGAVLTLLFVLERMVAGPQSAREVVRFGDAH
jgi:TRAP-type C4-dicarboxylate transport system permease small subunit